MYNTTIFDKLKTDGFYEFNIKDSEKLDVLKRLASITKEINYTSACHTGMYDNYSSDKPFNELEEMKKEVAPMKLWQFWYQCSNIHEYITREDYDKIRQIFIDIVSECYPPNIFSEITVHPHITMFNKQCYINRHTDGTSGVLLCNILLYLNEDYQSGMGGELVVNDTNVIVPTFGKVAILDFKHNNPAHAVNEVLDENFKRCAIIVGFNYENQ
jgi:Rps23 Pro-64 3,4-dihydroxylase Tpa1-like proline 4-hydroxylase